MVLGASLMDLHISLCAVLAEATVQGTLDLSGSRLTLPLGPPSFPPSSREGLRGCGVGAAGRVTAG